MELLQSNFDKIINRLRKDGKVTDFDFSKGLDIIEAELNEYKIQNRIKQGMSELELLNIILNN